MTAQIGETLFVFYANIEIFSYLSFRSGDSLIARVFRFSGYAMAPYHHSDAGVGEEEDHRGNYVLEEHQDCCVHAAVLHADV